MENLRDMIDKKLNSLPEDDLDQILTFAEFLAWKENSGKALGASTTLDQKDTLIGLFDGPANLAEQSETLLERGFEEHSGWTWKDS